MVAAIYVLLTYLSSLMGLASGVIQLRLSESLCILPVFFPEATLGLFIGCLISNLVTGGVIWDVIFGSLATLIGALLARALRRLPPRLSFVITLPTVFSNAIIVPFILQYAYGAEGAYFYFFLTVLAGELLSATLLGTPLYFIIRKNRRFLS